MSNIKVFGQKFVFFDELSVDVQTGSGIYMTTLVLYILLYITMFNLDQKEQECSEKMLNHLQ